LFWRQDSQRDVEPVPLPELRGNDSVSYITSFLTLVSMALHGSRLWLSFIGTYRIDLCFKVTYFCTQNGTAVDPSKLQKKAGIPENP
jgi:hypothetical protein